MLAAGSRCVFLNVLPRAHALAIIRQSSSSSQSNKNKDEPVAVSVDDSGSSPMSQRPLPPDDGKVRM